MNVKNVLKNLNFSIEKNELHEIEKKTREIVFLIKNQVARRKIKADVFVGGSFGKKTLMKSHKQDIDVFLRFDKVYENISALTENVSKYVAEKINCPLEKIHGSRDYFRIVSEDIIFEIIPVRKIKRGGEAQNVTDLSYFHVGYIKRNSNPRLLREIILAKKFCKAQRIYGAESYIQGFSGYALECLIIYYGSFEKMINTLVKFSEREIIDPARFYKCKADAIVQINASRIQGPIVLVDPTWKERNVLSALSYRTFDKFKKSCKSFLKKPSESFFLERDLDINKIKSRKGEFVHAQLKTDRQEGDIAGTKIRKVSEFLIRKLGRYFKIVAEEFDYLGGQEGDLYVVVKPLGEIIRRGPNLTQKKHAEKFRKYNEKVFVKDGVLYTLEKVEVSAKEFLKKFIVEYSEQINSMGVMDIKIVSN